MQLHSPHSMGTVLSEGLSSPQPLVWLVGCGPACIRFVGKRVKYTAGLMIFKFRKGALVLTSSSIRSKPPVHRSPKENSTVSEVPS